jgi:hypothetical protein
MSRTILNKNSEIDIVLLKKFNNNTINYYISPTIGIELYNAKVSWIDPYKKNISFGFNKYENASLLLFLKSIYNKFDNIYHDNAYNKYELYTLAPFYYEKDDFFYIKCYLPRVKNIYSIKSEFNGNVDQFTLPNKDCIYNSIVIDFRNIWETNKQAGFNMELKITKTNF